MVDIDAKAQMYHGIEPKNVIFVILGSRKFEKHLKRYKVNLMPQMNKMRGFYFGHEKSNFS